MQQEIERVQIWQFVAFDLAFADSGEMPFDALGGDFTDKDRVMLRFERDQADVGRVAFVARSRMSDFDKLYLHNILLHLIPVLDWIQDEAQPRGSRGTRGKTRPEDVLNLSFIKAFPFSSP